MIRPSTPTDAERATWWRTGRPSERDLHDWKFQVALDLLGDDRRPGDINENDDPNEHTIVPSQVLPGAAFTGTARTLAIRDIEADVPRNVFRLGGDAWSCIFTSHMAGAGDKHTAFDARERLRRGELPPRAEQVTLNRVFDELFLREFADLAAEEDWTVERAAEIARLAGTVNERICWWLNQYAELERIAPQPTPPPETALETWDRGWRQRITYRAADGRIETCRRR